MNDLAARYSAAPDFATYLGTVRKNAELWHALYDRTRIDDPIGNALEQLPSLKLLALSEDWCGDAVNILPVLARMVDASRALELRVLARDENLDLMDAHLTRGTRSIPVVMILDDAYHELGWWGPRPSELQDWVIGSGLAIEPRERYRRVRAWYAKDRGRTTAAEFLSELRNAVRRRAA